MIFAQNRQNVGSQWTAPYALPRDVVALKLSIRVRDVPVILQVSEDVEQFFRDDLSETSQLLDRGFHSLIFVSPITAWRFKAESLPTTIDFTAYG